MDQAIVDDELNQAAMEILARPKNIAVLMRVLKKVHLLGYGHGLDQGHHDRDFPEG